MAFIFSCIADVRQIQRNKTPNQKCPLQMVRAIWRTENQANPNKMLCVTYAFWKTNFMIERSPKADDIIVTS